MGEVTTKTRDKSVKVERSIGRQSSECASRTHSHAVGVTVHAYCIAKQLGLELSGRNC